MTPRGAELCCTSGKVMMFLAVVLGVIPAAALAFAFVLGVLGMELFKYGEREWNRLHGLPPPEHDFGRPLKSWWQQ